MKTKEFDPYMRRFQIDHGEVPPETFIVLHVDGDNFSRYTEDFEKPFDERLFEMFKTVGKILMNEFNGLYAYSQFDEISILLPKDFELFNRRIGKMISKSVSLAASNFSNMSGDVVGFATHVYSLPAEGNVIDYFKWRFADAFRNSVNTYAYWLLRDDGMTPQQCARAVKGKDKGWKIAFLKDHGIDINEVPSWQTKGFDLTWEMYQKKGYNPARDEVVEVPRRRLVINHPPVGLPELPTL